MIFGVGTDLVEIGRIQKAIEKYPRFLQKVYTEEEIRYCQRKKNPWQSFAARFAAKEAVSKAFGTGLGKIALTDIEVVNHSSGQPYVRLYGAAQMFAQEHGMKYVHISLSHSELYAMATAIIEGE